MDDETSPHKRLGIFTRGDKRAFIGTLLKRFRVAREVSQHELAAAIGTSRPHISDLETNKAVPALDELMKLADALKVGPSAFLPRDLRRPGESWEILAGRLQLTFEEAMTLRGLLETAGQAETASVEDALLVWMHHRKVIP